MRRTTQRWQSVGWGVGTGAYQSSGDTEKLYLNFASSPSISTNASPRDVRCQSIDETLHLHSHIFRRAAKFQIKAEAPSAAKIIAC